jgi:hypothetical protein
MFSSFFSYDAIVTTFRIVGIDASFEESTSNAECKKKIKQWQLLSAADKDKLGKHLLTANKSEVSSFMNSLEKAITRQIESIVILLFTVSQLKSRRLKKLSNG